MIEVYKIEIYDNDEIIKTVRVGKLKRKFRGPSKTGTKIKPKVSKPANKCAGCSSNRLLTKVNGTTLCRLCSWKREAKHDASAYKAGWCRCDICTEAYYA
jgi:hypothetical protein